MATIIESDSLTIVAFKRKRSNDESVSVSIASNILSNSEIVHVTNTSSGITNTAFSSTPNRKCLTGQLKSGCNSYVDLEIKSIEALVSSIDRKKNLNYKENCVVEADGVEENPFEVHRRPPKKKTKKEEHKSKNESCFENAALNLALPEKQFNPFEVIRNRESGKAITSHCFTNAALNLKDQDTSIIRNPFEISREAEQQQIKINKNDYVAQQVKNSHFNSDKVTKQLQINLPFQPTVGCRINFQDISLSQLSPSKLLADKLVFSPSSLGIKHKKTTSLSVINEEDSTVDIGKELDRYQLELENSINEAKLNKNDTSFDKKTKISYKMEKKQVNELNKKQQNENVKNDIDVVTNDKTNKEMNKLVKNIAIRNPFLCDDESDIKPEELYNEEESDTINEEESLEEISPTPFVRNYRKPEIVCTTIPIDKQKNDIKVSKDEKEKSTTNVGKLLRRSIRKLINSQQQQKSQSKEEINKDDLETKIDNQKESKMKPIQEEPKQSKEKCNSENVNVDVKINKAEQTNKDNIQLNENGSVVENRENNQGFINTIRRSLRRNKKPSNPIKNYTNLCFEEKENEVNDKNKLNVSIIDTGDRKLKLKSEMVETEYLKIEDLAGERKPTGIRNSIRRSIFGRKNINGHYFKHN